MVGRNPNSGKKDLTKTSATRKAAIMKKAEEISLLCGGSSAVVIFGMDDNGSPYVWPPSSETLTSTIQRFLNMNSNQRNKNYSKRVTAVSDSVQKDHRQLERDDDEKQSSDHNCIDFLSFEKYELQRSELVSHIERLQREVSSLSSSSLFREKESLRKDLEKTRTKLKETESKLKNVMHEKTRIEGEKANAEREVKKLQSQKALLDSKRARNQENNIQPTLLEEFKKLEVLAADMELLIASLEELGAANQEKEEMSARNFCLSSELEMLSDKLDTSNTELNALQEEISDLRLKLEKSEASHQKLESQTSLLVQEKEELATEERAVWSAKEKASLEATKEKAKACKDELGLLSSELSKVKKEMLLVRKEYEALEERMKCAEEQAILEKRCSMEKSAEIDQLKHAVKMAHSEKRASDYKLLRAQSEAQQLGSRLADLEHKMHDDDVKNSKERAKLRMVLQCTQNQLDAYCERYKEALIEQEFMDKKYEEASAKLKEQLASYGIMVVNLKKQLAAAKTQCSYCSFREFE